MADLDVTFTQLSQLSRAYGAPAVEMASRIMQRDATAQLVVGGGLVVAAAALVFATIRLGAMATKEFRADYGDDNLLKAVGGMIGAMLSGIAALFMGGGGLTQLIDIWAWTALTDPQLALAHRIFGSMGG